MAILTILPFLVPPEQVPWLRWRIGSIVGGLIAIIAFGIQMYMQYQEEKKMRAEDEKRNRSRDKKIDELLRRSRKSRLTQDAAYDPTRIRKETLTERVEQLAHEYYECLQEGITRAIYESRLKPKLLALLPELDKSPFRVNISEADIEAKQLYAGMRETADSLALAAAKMENPKTRIENRYLVLDEDESR